MSGNVSLGSGGVSVLQAPVTCCLWNSVRHVLCAVWAVENSISFVALWLSWRSGDRLGPLSPVINCVSRALCWQWFVGTIGRKRGPLIMMRRVLMRRTDLVIGTGVLLNWCRQRIGMLVWNGVLGVSG